MKSVNKKEIKKTLTRIEKGTKNLYSVWVLLICCYIDALGKEIYRNNNSKCRFKQFIFDRMAVTYKELEEKSEKDGKHKEHYLDLLYSDIRCGLVHEYFPKSKTKVIYSKGSCIVDISVKFPNCDLVINARRFREDFLAALNKL